MYGGGRKMEQTIRELYQKIAGKLMKFLVANNCPEAMAEDIVQETFLRLTKMSDTLDTDPARLSGLAYTIARNYRNDLARKAKHEVLQGEIGEDEGGTAAPAPAPSDAEYLRARITQAFAALPPLLREAYTLFQVMELPVAEIARRTGASESLVKVRIFRAKEKLRPLLKDLL